MPHVKLHTAALLATLVLSALACGGSETEEDLNLAELGIGFERDDDGNLVQSKDVNKDGETDVQHIYEEIPDPDDPSVKTMRRLRKYVDVNFDGSFNLVRHYNEDGEVMREEVDSDLDGKFDAINHIDNGKILRKEILDPETGEIIAVRYYDNGELLRVEKDLSGDSKIDYWEYYERGILDRIGRDLNADGRADSWQTR